ncbi:teichoic acids export ABC transporter ATP-binding subunit TagH [Bacillus sp. AFS037270]|uniref:teichoic acids export ABC transporter ATP-binding subunit TagH n=1 Tax=Bacillus sp. AFS037270 TaxID=2033499 RepID=UPI000BFCB106|nr:teichoic acids export ABC transporter ATP-binding subunit TagH [Bacillus sp. AFS037270]PGV53338.1 teichoic acid ABC transporter ATP-binding protein [Bacillus sp. AFS037270]
MDNSVVFEHVTKKYKMYKKTSDKLLDLALPQGYGKDFYALQNINFTAKNGDVIGIIGVNGAGKSTMSNLISGVIPPTQGKVTIKGEAALISIAAGLNNELTGRENIELKCLMLGFRKDDIERLMPEIIEFADIGQFIDQPVKKYSSGMKSRLGFAISVNIDPDILVIDEALSVGDKTFYQKCVDKMNSFKDKGKTIFFISHSIGQVKEFCQKALWLEAGEVRAFGPVEEVVPKYEKFIREFNKLSKEEKKQFNNEIMERRSRAQVSPESKTSDTLESSSTPVPGIGSLSRLKPKKKSSSLWLNSLLVIVLLIGAAVLLFKWNNVVTYFQADKREHVTNEEKSKEASHAKEAEPASKETTAPVKDVRYVLVNTGFVRDMPDYAESQKVTTVNFGDAITVEEMKEDPVQGFNWLKFKLATGQDVWISEKLVTKLEPQPDESEFVASVSSLTDNDQLGESLSAFGKSEQEIGADADPATMAFNDQGQLSELHLNLDRLTRQEVMEQLGEPALRLNNYTYLYHGEDYDFILYANNLGHFTKMTVRPVSG